MEVSNIYKIARERSGLTQEEAAFRLDKSVRSISNYETLDTIPSNEVVAKMIEVYNARWLAPMHVMNDEYLGIYFPKIDLKNIAQAALRVQKEIADFKKVVPDMIEIAYDGVIEDHERKSWNNVIFEAMDVAGATWTLAIAEVIDSIYERR